MRARLWGPSSAALLSGLQQVLSCHWASPLSRSQRPDVAKVPFSPIAHNYTSGLQKLVGERDGLQRELEELKKKFEGVKSRNKVLSSEVKTLRSQMGTLAEKGRHDDELIDALMVWPGPSNLSPHPAQKPMTQPQLQ